MILLMIVIANVEKFDAVSNGIIKDNSSISMIRGIIKIVCTEPCVPGKIFMRAREQSQNNKSIWC